MDKSNGSDKLNFYEMPCAMYRNQSMLERHHPHLPFCTGCDISLNKIRFTTLLYVFLKFVVAFSVFLKEIFPRFVELIALKLRNGIWVRDRVAKTWCTPRLV